MYEIKKKNITNDDLLYNTLCKGMPKIIPDTIVKTLNSVSFTTDEDFDEILKYEYK